MKTLKKTTFSIRELCQTVPLLPAPPHQKVKESCESCFNLKEHFEKELRDIKKIIVKQNGILIKGQSDQKVLLERILYQESTCNNERLAFPIKSLENLNILNNMIREDNRDIYVNIMKSLLKGRLSKTLTEVISTSVCMEVNIDGIQGKKRLKDFSSFYQALTDACRSYCSSEVEKDLKNALKIIKKRLIHRKCVINKKLNKAT